MGGLKGDFISFSFNGVHSSKLGITRTSDGSRYNENLLPTIQDKTVQVPGADGTYFFGSFYTQRQFSVPIAFDSLTEAEYRKLRQHFGDKGIHELIFDERPYKVYMAKATGTPQLKTICFEEEGKRIYKGEGTLTFTAYYPFARSRFKYLDQYTNNNIYPWEDQDQLENNGDSLIANFTEWKDSSGMLETQDNYDQIGGSEINLYNPGDLETDFKIYFDVSSGTCSLNSISIGENGELTFKDGGIAQKDEDEAFCINSKSNLIEGVKLINDKFEPTGTLYNEYIEGGDFFKVPLGSSIFESAGANAIKIEYDYIYY